MNSDDLLLGLEVSAVLLAVGYLVLAVRQDIRCWIAGIVSSLIYLLLMYKANLYMESVLQIFYVCMGIYGWSQWKVNKKDETNLTVSTWSFKRHALVISSVVLFSFLAGNLLEVYTNAALPFLDSFTTFGALVATYMVTKKILENWIYWFVIDSVSVVLFFSRELFFTSVLFIIYLLIIYFGYKSWLASYKNNLSD
ncbi:MAG TPA: nicotinamide riboside transporter PnuC [SAR86 cluster bacterium]|nr:nicotinamide riboside transporter PnuC [SAR86 cluster bacterium]